MAGAALSSTALETGAEGTPAALAGSALAAAPSAAEAAEAVEAQAAAAVETPLLVQTAGSVAAPTGKQAKRHAATSFALRPAEPCSNASAIAPAVSRCDATSAADTRTSLRSIASFFLLSVAVADQESREILQLPHVRHIVQLRQCCGYHRCD